MKFAIRAIARRLGLLSAWNLARTDSALRRLGWFRSVKTQLPVDSSGRPLPWYTYPAISFMEGIDFTSLSVFEYGMGNSTLWWAARAGSVRSCDHDATFESFIGMKLPANAKSLGAFQESSEYISALHVELGPMDVVVVDGNWRNECLGNAVLHLSDRGVILLDNSERDEYDPGRRMLLGRGFRELRFTGMGPINHYCWSTSIFYRDANCLGI